MRIEVMQTWPPPFAGRPAAVVAATILAVVAAVTVSPWTLPAAGLLLVAAWRWPLRAAVYYPALLAATAVAVFLVPYAMFASWILALHAFVLFGPRAAFAWSVAGALVITFAQTRDLEVPAVISLLAPLIAAGWFLSTTLRENLALRDRLVEQAKLSGVQEERNRMAREIHDTIAQDLSAAVALLEGAIHDGVHEPRVGQARDLARNGLAEARRSVLALGPRSLDGSGLAGALRRLVDAWAARTGVRGNFASDPDAHALDPETEAALFRIGQSALANVASHASATRVDVTLSYLDHEVVLDIRDDGVGFVFKNARGFGLAGMRQRLDELDGSLEVESEPGAGTALRAAVPLR
ncbi:sensor histidine kinase [Paractinoplanes lichenicola]|uniref:Oxygen sensor histidine kinase NreB n=1 Tax=Paractinoplanes lichenicola TaxID=2802976 RepID=A0ABS1VZ20_9ACTN|nr:sensor histidine kinase [Actinoplanes lichenicola]MBL7259747.1 sensor histidine kinase [Actinoplanes lichenicola]